MVQPAAENCAGRTTSRLRTSSVESLALIWVLRYWACCSDVLPPTVTSILVPLWLASYWSKICCQVFMS